MADESTDYSSVLSRRRFVELTGVTGAAALAGCDGDDGTDSPEPTETTDGTDEETTTDGGGETEVHDVEHRSGTTVVPSDVQFNDANGAGAPQAAHRVLFENLAQYSFVEGGYMPGAIEEWNFTGDELELQLRDDLVWSNGDQVTAEDFVRQMEVWETTQHPVWEWAGGVEATDDTTAVVSVASDVNSALVEFDVFEDWLRYPADPFDDIKDDAEALSTTRIDDPTTNGPFTFDQKDDSSLLASRFEDWRGADDINFANYSFNVLGGGANPPRQQALLAGEMDSEFSLFVPARIVADLPDYIQEARTPSKWGFGLAPNHDRAFVEDRSVRQAISYVINRDQVRLDAGPRVKETVPIPTGICSADQEEWLGDAADDFEDYGPESRLTDEATTVLEDDGYSRVDGTWEDDSGNVVSLPVAVPGGWSDWVLAAETCVEHLSAFGFESEIDSISAGNYWPRKGASEFTLLANGWAPGAPRGSYPYYSLTHQLWEPLEHDVNSNYPGHKNTEFLQGEEADITVPARGGDGTLTVNPGDRINELATTNDDATIEEIVVELAWVCNQDLPHIPIVEKVEQSWYSAGGESNWSAPENPGEDPDVNVQWACTWLPHVGKMQYSP